MKPKRDSKEGGYVLIGVLIMTALTLLVTSGMLDFSASNAKTRAIVTTQAENYYEVEETLNRVVAWLQTNSKYLITAFNSANFSSNFDLGSPSTGANEGQHFSVPTMVKMAGTNDSVLLSNNSFFGVSAFPPTEHIDTSVSFDAVNEFSSANLGPANARVILIWARESDGNYEPIFRIDVVTGNNPDRGVHSYSYVYSTLQGAGSGAGFYGQNFVSLQTPNNECTSYQYSGGSKGAPRSNCGIASDGAITTRAKINGSARSLIDPGITLHSPGGEVSGTTCEGSGCHGISLPAPQDWNTECAGSTLGDKVISSNQSLPAGCYTDVTINNNKTLTLNDYASPSDPTKRYYFRTLNYGGNNAELAIAAVPGSTDKVVLYVENVSANGNSHINGKKLVNGNSHPDQFEMYYTGANALTLNGNVNMSAVLYSPYAQVNVLGTFDYFGVLHALALDVGGTATLNEQEGVFSSTPPNDLTFKLKKTSQRYR